MPRKAPDGKGVIEHRITLGDYERKILTAQLSEDDRLNKARTYTQIGKAIGVTGAVVGGTIVASTLGTLALAAYRESADLVDKALKDIASKAPDNAPTTPDLILEAVASNFQLTPIDLKSRKRDKETALARRVAMYLIRQETSCTLTQIGTVLGGRDHSAVSNACEKITR